MAKTITQKVVFKKQKAENLYDMFLDARQHSAITGGNKAKISPRNGAAFSVHEGYVTGKSLQLIPGRLIVQSWFGSDWNPGERDSTFILLFLQKGRDAVIQMTHANIPDKQAEGIRKGWTEFYWKPWKKYLTSAKTK